jgi:hypothetical protein
MKNWKLINPGTTIKNKETFQDAIEFLALPKNDVVFINHKNRRRKTATFLLEIENTLECIFSALSQAILVLILNFDWYPGNTKTGDNCSSTWQLQIPRKKSHFKALNPPPRSHQDATVIITLKTCYHTFLREDCGKFLAISLANN